MSVYESCNKIHRELLTVRSFSCLLLSLWLKINSILRIYFSFPACPHGTYGVNCSSECPSAHNGRFCDKKCECATYHYCDPRNGCQECPPGTFGLNCYGKCLNKYYEQFCVKRCTCTSDQYCNARDDCLQCLLRFKGECYRICNTGYYGRICHKESNCTSNQDCDQLYGCLQEQKGKYKSTCFVSTRERYCDYYIKQLLIF